MHNPLVRRKKGCHCRYPLQLDQHYDIHVWHDGLKAVKGLDETISEIGWGEDFWERHKLTGDGRCKRLAASLSPGASNVTTGAPYVTPTRLASDPPKECPIIQMLEWGLKYRNECDDNVSACWEILTTCRSGYCIDSVKAHQWELSTRSNEREYEQCQLGKTDSQ